MIRNDDKFWSLVDKRESGCWEWSKGRASTGYGKVYIPGRGSVYAHRRAYELTRGPIPHGMHILHACDNPPCCNPDHLRVGTHRENMADMFARGRANRPFGERQYKARLTASVVADLRRRARAGESQSAMARALGVSEPTVNRAIRGDDWKCVSEPTWQASKSRPVRCKRGHAYGAARSGNGRRVCMECRHARQSETNRRRRERRALRSTIYERNARANVVNWLRAHGPSSAVDVAAGLGRPKSKVGPLLHCAMKRGEAVRVRYGVYEAVLA